MEHAALDLFGIAALALVAWAITRMWRLGDRWLAVAVSAAMWVVLGILLSGAVR